MKICGDSPEEMGVAVGTTGLLLGRATGCILHKAFWVESSETGWQLHKGALERLKVTLAGPDWGAEGWHTSGSHQNGIQRRPRVPLR